MIFVGGLFADIDTREGPHGSKDKPVDPMTLPADEKEALKLIEEAGLPVPTCLVRTGGVCHPPLALRRADHAPHLQERAAEKMLSKALQNRLRGVFKATATPWTAPPTCPASARCPAP